jgi:uncharacterized protein YbaA (DUF1428 family)
MGKYVDGFVLAVPKSNLEAYRRMAEDAGKVWREYGALEYVECVADDVKPGEVTSFPQAVKLEPDETVVFARASRSRQRAGPEGSQNRQRGSQIHAVRRQAHDLGRLQGARRALT